MKSNYKTRIFNFVRSSNKQVISRTELRRHVNDMTLDDFDYCLKELMADGTIFSYAEKGGKTMYTNYSPSVVAELLTDKEVSSIVKKMYKSNESSGRINGYLKCFLSKPDFEVNTSRALSSWLLDRGFPASEYTLSYLHNFISLYRKKSPRRFSLRQCKVEPGRIWIRRIA